MFCPQCRTEYREGFTLCADCNVPLIDYLPPEPIPDDMAGTDSIDDDFDKSAFSILLVATTLKELTAAKSALIDAGIPFNVRNKSDNMTGCPENTDDYGLPATLEVPEDYLGEARALFSPPIPKPDPETVVRELEHSFFRNLALYAIPLGASLAIVYLGLPDMMEEGPKILIFCLASFAAIVLGNVLRLMNQPPPDSKRPVSPENAYPDWHDAFPRPLYEPPDPVAPRKLMPRIMVNVILLVTALTGCGLLFYFYGWGIDNIPAGRFDRLNPAKIERIAGAYQRKLEKDPVNIAYLCGLGAAHNELSRYDTALKYFDRAIVIDPGNKECRYGRGLAYFNIREYGKAKNDFTAVIDSDRKYTDVASVYYARGNCFLMSGYYAKAIEDYDNALRHDPAYAKAYHMRARAYFTFLDNCGKALEDMAKALEIQPDEPYFLNSMAQILAVCPDKAYRDVPRAIELAQNALRRAGSLRNVNDIAGFHSTAAAAYAQSGDFRKAAQHQQKAYELYRPVDAEDRTKDTLFNILASYKKEMYPR